MPRTARIAAVVATLGLAAATAGGGAGCDRGAPLATRPDAARTAAADPARDRDFDATLAAIGERRAQLGRAYAAAHDDAGRAAVRAEARAYLLRTIDQDLFPPWLGTPWGLGRNSTSTRPHQPGMTVGCSYFVTSILGNAGFRLDDRYRFAQAPALDIQRSLARGSHAIARFLSIPADQLARRIAALGDGLYLIGLSNHVGWVVVDGDRVRLVHASYTGGRVVSDEPLAGAVAIDASRKAGYFVSPVIVADARNDWLIDAWLRGATVRFRGGDG
ncbi:MAG: hypothetical protein H6708_10535 [Kofleriaceae bacterium]|nr:hypothetical protein [Kofleriaceae bacterium]